MAVPRDGNYVWATWLSGLMTGDKSCEWAPWFRTHYADWDRPPSDFDEATWNIAHTRLLREVRREVAESGADILVESQAQFYYDRPSGLTLSGKPDLVAICGDEATVYDAKTGRPRASDKVQVMIYMHCLREKHLRLAGKTMSGQVVYTDHRVDVPGDAVDADFGEQFDYFLDILDSETPALKVPSRLECRYCNIAKSECPERIEEDAAPARP